MPRSAKFDRMFRDGFVYQVNNPLLRNFKRRQGNRKGTDDAFNDGRAHAAHLMDLVPNFHSLILRAVYEQKRTIEFYRDVRIRGRREPCVTCSFIAFCRETEYTCPRFRNYVSGKAARSLSVVSMIPDRHWTKSFKEDDETPGPPKCLN